jgi:hypothetical protein
MGYRGTIYCVTSLVEEDFLSSYEVLMMPGTWIYIDQ